MSLYLQLLPKTGRADLFPLDHTSADIKANFEEGKKVVIAGRLMSRRIQGKASFAELQDSKGKIQVYFNRDEICTGEDKSKYNDIYKKLLDIGDFIGIEGELFKTQVGEKTVMVKDFSLLSKSIRPLPLPRKYLRRFYRSRAPLSPTICRSCCKPKSERDIRKTY